MYGNACFLYEAFSFHPAVLLPCHAYPESRLQRERRAQKHWQVRGGGSLERNSKSTTVDKRAPVVLSCFYLVISTLVLHFLLCFCQNIITSWV